MFLPLYISKQAGTVSVNDFHQVLQDVTNFPLRPFVLPFLKANIPLLSREIAALAAITNHTPIQYLRTHQHLLIESSRSTNATSSSGKKNVFNNMYGHITYFQYLRIDVKVVIKPTFNRSFQYSRAKRHFSFLIIRSGK